MMEYKMKRSRCLTIITVVIALLCLQQAAFAIPDYEVSFVKGDINQKKKAVITAGEQGMTSLSLKAIDFALAEHSTLGDDADLVMLLEAAIQAVGTDPAKVDAKTLSQKLGEVFTVYKDDTLRMAVLDRLVFFPSTESVNIINSYVSDCALQKAAMTNVLLKAIGSLGKIGNASSFSLLFAVDLDEIWPQYAAQIEYSLGLLANNNEKAILNIYASAPIDKKLKILQMTSKSSTISKNIKGDVAQNALAETITIAGTPTAEQLSLQRLSLQTLADANWTRAATLVTSYFPVAKNEYENGLLSVDQFAQVITCTGVVASSETDQILSLYLDSLNKSMEKNMIPETKIVLAVINALGGLGDKTAFDYLLYVTYLEYPEEVISAARNALAKLKW